jgi:hypothetical protein
MELKFLKKIVAANQGEYSGFYRTKKKNKREIRG